MLGLERVSDLSLAVAERECDDGWRFFRGKCYLLGRQEVTYAEASRICNGFGASLVSLNTREENYFVQAM
jgi:hypothetical protein